MTTSPQSHMRDTQDNVQRGVWGGRQDVAGAGSMMTVRGTGTTDFQVPIVNVGYSFNLGEGDFNAEVVMLSLGSDVNDKVAFPVLPRDLQYQWPSGTGGVQHPTDPERRLEYNGEETWLKDGEYKLGNNKEVSVTVAGGQVTINVDGNAAIEASGDMQLTAAGSMTLSATDVDVRSSTLTHNGTNVGDDHTHPGVDTGSGSTQGPE